MLFLTLPAPPCISPAPWPLTRLQASTAPPLSQKTLERGPQISWVPRLGMVTVGVLGTAELARSKEEEEEEEEEEGEEAPHRSSNIR